MSNTRWTWWKKKPTYLCSAAMMNLTCHQFILMEVEHWLSSTCRNWEAPCSRSSGSVYQKHPMIVFSSEQRQDERKCREACLPFGLVICDAKYGARPFTFSFDAPARPCFGGSISVWGHSNGAWGTCCRRPGLWAQQVPMACLHHLSWLPGQCHK